MAIAIINGKQVVLPDVATDNDIRRHGNIDPKRGLFRRTREGNFKIPRGTSVTIGEGDVFIDAPARVKGR